MNVPNFGATTLPKIYESDLTAGWYPQYAPIPWGDAKLWDIINWAIENGANEPSIEARFGYASQPVPADFVWTGSGGRTNCDAVDLLYRPNAVIITILQACGQRIDEAHPPRYPGYDIRHSVTESPIGELWPSHSEYHPVGRRIYRPSSADNLPLGRIHPEFRHEDGAIHYFEKRVRMIGAGAFSSGRPEFYFQDLGVALPGEGKNKKPSKKR